MLKFGFFAKKIILNFQLLTKKCDGRQKKYLTKPKKNQ